MDRVRLCPRSSPVGRVIGENVVLSRSRRASSENIFNEKKRHKTKGQDSRGSSQYYVVILCISKKYVSIKVKMGSLNCLLLPMAKPNYICCA